MKAFSHIDESGRPAMVDISAKPDSQREAVALAVVELPARVQAAMSQNDIRSKKGPVFHTAIIAGTQAVKRTAELIPFCHPLIIEKCHIDITPVGARVEIRCHVAVSGKTGVEMEALTGASTAALTIYDMCKALSHDIVIAEIRLLSKSGGKSDAGGEA